MCWAEDNVDGVDGVRELHASESRRGMRGILTVGGAPLRIEGFDGVLVEGKEDREP